MPASPEDTVLKSARVGSLTVLLAQTVRRVIAVEIDRGLIAPLTEAVSEYDNVQIVEGDILKIPPEELNLGEAYLVGRTSPTTSVPRLSAVCWKPKTDPAHRADQRGSGGANLRQRWQVQLLALSVQVLRAASKRASRWVLYPAPDVDLAVLA